RREQGGKKKAPLARGQVVSWEKTSNRGRVLCSAKAAPCGCGNVTHPTQCAGGSRGQIEDSRPEEKHPRRCRFSHSSRRGQRDKKKAPLARGQVVSWEKT